MGLVTNTELSLNVLYEKIQNSDSIIHNLDESLASVAITGNYNDLTNKPEIGIANNQAITNAMNQIF